MYVAEQGGTVRVVDDGHVVGPAVLQVAVSHGDEQGLLGLTFSPDGSTLYVDYTDPRGDSHIVEYTMRGRVANIASRRELIFQQQPFANHNGGDLVTGPDGLLYITFGDGGNAGDPFANAQNLDVLLGKILRLDPHEHGAAPYTIPADNPFAARSGVRGEIWMYGLRNPWRFSFDRANGNVWIGDVGQNLYEEIDYSPAGQTGINWGWSAREGLHPYEGGGSSSAPGARDPIIETSHRDGNCAIVGGYVYRGKAIPDLNGVYLYGDDCTGTITGASERNGKIVEQRGLGLTVEALTTFAEDPNGELYAVARGGSISRFSTG